MSLKTKRTLNDLTNENKHFKNDSAIDLHFDIKELKNKKSQHSYSTSLSSGIESFIEDDSIFDDDVFEDEQSVMTSLSKTTSQNQGRKRLNGTSTYRIKENKNKRKTKFLKKENLVIDQTLNQLREEQARIDAHSLSTNVK